MKQPHGPPDSPPQQDQRRQLRVPMIVEKISCSDGHKTFFGYASNISCGGVFIATVNPREPGDQFALHMTLPAGEPITLQCRCEVVWKRHFKQGGKYVPGMGLRFLDLAPDSTALLERWLQSPAASGSP